VTASSHNKEESPSEGNVPCGLMAAGDILFCLKRNPRMKEKEERQNPIEGQHYEQDPTPIDLFLETP